MCNGRRGNDKDVGNFTCYTKRGKSLVDYVLCSSSLIPEIIDFDIKDPNEFSVHCAIEFSLCINTMVTETVIHDNMRSENVNYFFKWNSEHKTLWLVCRMKIAIS